MNRKLLIGLTGRETTVYGQPAVYDNLDYVRYLRAADPDILCMILPTLSASEAESYASLLDGLCITGGEDLSPSLYDQEKDPSTTVYADSAFDESDLLLFHAFEKVNKPILGICRGIQLINVACGGDLIQDIPSILNTEHNQRRLKPQKGDYDTSHSVHLVQGTRMYGLFGSTCTVNSFHHQAIDTPAPGFTVSAYSSDGIIEGIEKNRILAVQWHPERLQKDSKMIALAKLFLNDCRSF